MARVAQTCLSIIPPSVRSVIFIDDGMLKFVVAEIGEDYVVARAANGGMLGSRKGVNLPDAAIDMPPLSAKDLGMP